MIELILIGIGSGNPQHMTLEAIAALEGADVVLVPNKGSGKQRLAQIRKSICAEHAPHVPLVDFRVPERRNEGNYRLNVDEWHRSISDIWLRTLTAEFPNGDGKAALLVWGDPSLYDSTLRIAEQVRESLPLVLRVIPGVSAIQALTAAHKIPLNTINGPVLVTTGRHLRQHGWPEGISSLVVMLDGECSFQYLAPEGVEIWWCAYAGMEEELTLSGRLTDIGVQIIRQRAEARAKHGWIMDIYLMRREPHIKFERR